MHAATTAALTSAVIMATAATPAGTIVVTPGAAQPGQRVHISVPDCSVGPTSHTAASAAFDRDVVLIGKAETGDADPTIRKNLKPGTYSITAHCGENRTVQGQVMIAGRERPGSDAPYWALGALAVVLAAGAGVFLLRGRTRR